MLKHKSYLSLFEDSYSLSYYFLKKVTKNKETARTTKDILCQKVEYDFIMFCKRVFDVTKIIQKIKNIELLFFHYYKP